MAFSLASALPSDTLRIYYPEDDLLAFGTVQDDGTIVVSKSTLATLRKKFTDIKIREP